MSYVIAQSEINDLALEIANKSTAVKRKVGAVIVSQNDCGELTVLSSGFNQVRFNAKEACEDKDGKTKPSVVHAEVSALEDLAALNLTNGQLSHCILYVTHTPCANCANAILESGIQNWELVESFMKHDYGKLDLTVVPSEAKIALAEMDSKRRELILKLIMDDLVPTSLLHEVVGILEGGAKKYKKDNWRKVEDTNRYVQALERHYDMGYKLGLWRDDESGFTHLGHIIVNAVFLLELEGNDK